MLSHFEKSIIAPRAVYVRENSRCGGLAAVVRLLSHRPFGC
jgi:hypothetical protein